VRSIAEGSVGVNGAVILIIHGKKTRDGADHFSPDLLRDFLSLIIGDFGIRHGTLF